MPRHPKADVVAVGCRPQHVQPFRLSSKARTASFKWLQSLTNETAWDYLKSIRFADNGGAPFSAPPPSSWYNVAVMSFPPTCPLT